MTDVITLHVQRNLSHKETHSTSSYKVLAARKRTSYIPTSNAGD